MKVTRFVMRVYIDAPQDVSNPDHAGRVVADALRKAGISAFITDFDIAHGRVVEADPVAKVALAPAVGTDGVPRVPAPVQP